MIDFIVNPIAGDKKGKKLKKTLDIIEKRLKERGVEYTVHFTEYHKHATVLTEEIIKNGADTVVAVGGAGTLSEVVNGFCDFERVSLGLIPCGTGNDFATKIGLPFDVERAVDVILDKTRSKFDFNTTNYQTIGYTENHIIIHIIDSNYDFVDNMILYDLL